MANQEIPRLTVHYRVHDSTLLVSILNQTHPILTFPYFSLRSILILSSLLMINFLTKLNGTKIVINCCVCNWHVPTDSFLIFFLNPGCKNEVPFRNFSSLIPWLPWKLPRTHGWLDYKWLHFIYWLSRQESIHRAVSCNIRGWLQVNDERISWSFLPQQGHMPDVILVNYVKQKKLLFFLRFVQGETLRVSHAIWMFLHPCKIPFFH